MFYLAFVCLLANSHKTTENFTRGSYVWFIETTNIPLPRFERTLTGVAAKMPQ